MRVFLPGPGPRIAQLRELALASGLELTESIAEAEVYLCCQPEPLTAPVTRHETFMELREQVQQLTGPITICLVSFQPNTLWPPGVCHAANTTIRGNTSCSWTMTRAHVQSSVLARTSPLILGADSPAASETLRAVWQALSELPEPLEVRSVLRAEFEADDSRTQPKSELDRNNPSVTAPSQA